MDGRWAGGDYAAIGAIRVLHYPAEEEEVAEEAAVAAGEWAEPSATTMKVIGSTRPWAIGIRQSWPRITGVTP